MNGHRHFSDDRLIELCLHGGAAPDGCTSCKLRYAELSAVLADVAARADDEVEEHFPAERLARQRARILQRLEHEGRPARVIAFPLHGHEAQVPRTRTAPAARWVAAAAVAGLLVGLLAGHFTHGVPGMPMRVPTASARATDAPPRAVHAVATTFSDDEFLGQIEMAADSPGGMALRPLHDLTPRAWEVK